MKKLSIVVPMYNEEAMISLFFDSVNKVIKEIKNYQVSITCVNDGSRDQTLSLLKKQREIQENIHIVSFSRNFGHEAAVAAGLKQCKGDVVIVMDADLQDPPELILSLLEKYEEGYDVVNAKRVNRKKDPFLKRITASMFYSFISKLSGKCKIPKNVGNYRLMSRRVVDLVNDLTEKNHVFRVQVPYVGFKTAEVEFVRPKRPKGETHYNYKSMFTLAGSSITSSSIIPLKWPLKFGLFLFVLSFLGLAACITLHCLNFIDNIWIIIPVVSLFASIILMSLGIMGEYIGRILIETQNRPLYYIEEEIDEQSK